MLNMRISFTYLVHYLSFTSKFSNPIKLVGRAAAAPPPPFPAPLLLLPLLSPPYFCVISLVLSLKLIKSSSICPLLC